MTTRFVAPTVSLAAEYESALNVQFVPPSANLPATLPAAVTLIVAEPFPAGPSNEPTAHAGSGSTVSFTRYVTDDLPAVVTVIFTSLGFGRPVFLSMADAVVGAP